MDEDEEDEDSEDEDIELDEDGEPIIKESVKKTSKLVKPKKITQLIVEDEDEDEDDEYDNYLQKFDNEIIKNYVDEFHPECLSHNYDEIAKLSVVIRNSDNIIVDPLHRTIPYLTKYERARILGQRAKQIETGARPLVKIPENIVDSYIIAELELREKKIPFIIRRPIPGGACEYWSLRDLEVIAF
jgi:DNA-directed RNA polymerase I, II, and III subunit RPABC2